MKIITTFLLSLIIWSSTFSQKLIKDHADFISAIGSVKSSSESIRSLTKEWQSGDKLTLGNLYASVKEKSDVAIDNYCIYAMKPKKAKNQGVDFASKLNDVQEAYKVFRVKYKELLPKYGAEAGAVGIPEVIDLVLGSTEKLEKLFNIIRGQETRKARCEEAKAKALVDWTTGQSGTKQSTTEPEKRTSSDSTNVKKTSGK